MTLRKKLIEVALPLDAINEASAREKSIRHGHPSTLHLWWARRPLAACRAVLFGQLVDDPSSWPSLFPTDEAQDVERQRLFRLIEQLVTWENSTNETVINAARFEIARSLARGRKAEGQADERDEAVLRVQPKVTGGGVDVVAPKDAETVNRYLAEVAPPVHDPFAGGGSIPLEAQRLGLRAIATDLNPVAVLINKALIEIPPKFAGRPPVNPEARAKKETITRTWKGAQGLAEDVRYYGKWMRDEALRKIGHLYPPVKVTREMVAERPDLKPYEGQELTVIAWLWARTVASPNPACNGVHVPLVSSFWLSKKGSKAAEKAASKEPKNKDRTQVLSDAWIEPVVDRASNEWRFEIRVGKPDHPKEVDNGTKTGRGDFRCLLSGDAIPVEHIRKEAQAGRLQDRLMAIVADGIRCRVYLAPQKIQEKTARVVVPDGAPDTDLPDQALGFRVQNYGMQKHRDLFTPRQLTALVSFSDLVTEARAKAIEDAKAAGFSEGDGLEVGGLAARAYSDAISVYLAIVLDKTIDGSSTICRWMVQRDSLFNTFAKHALPMVWDFAEVNVMADCTRSLSESLSWTVESMEGIPTIPIYRGSCDTAPADRIVGQGTLVSTDPPYYDNIGYADLSDYFYTWLRRPLRNVLRSLFATTLVPKSEELIATPFRFDGNKDRAKVFFESR